MEIINTASWLQTYINKRKNTLEDNMQVHEEILCQPLVPYFKQTDAQAIQHHLIQHGMFYPDPTDKHIIENIIAKNYWRIVKQQLQNLEKMWSKYNGAIFLYPSDFTNAQLLEQFNGVSGLSYTDKLFLFITDQTTELHLQALLTHEYNHVCRLQYFSELEHTLTLADALVLEGIAEIAVREQIGEAYCSPWIHLYSKEQISALWKHWLKSNINIPSDNLQHQALMYGTEKIPKWAGYAVGYTLVDHYMQRYNVPLNKLITIPTSEFFTKIGDL
ncbi:hypothetical protein BN1058_00246 [Paraliobacillus sp. PM-2]|uniref:DUF2268 domain-containing protein n=1 Tax=Paraliobacillus sp. PM-2 TaxID=1462524 RepID=UPI00061C870C|nr:DUF2268 domain-containing putative Zn-dependent protease [Paraliobacillus sp. PM-2]CQR46003.1 hypothetical protein BN1058_00246 [Paraliobacillus sp. PM-2]